MTRNVLNTMRAALVVAAGFPLIFASNAVAQLAAPGPSPGAPPRAAGATAEVGRVIVTGSNIPTAADAVDVPVEGVGVDADHVEVGDRHGVTFPAQFGVWLFALPP